MSASQLRHALGTHHRETLALAAALPDGELRIQPHPLLSPLGWHVGHCSFIETLWVQGELLGNWAEVERWRALYQPEMAYKPGRGDRLPNRDNLIEWCQTRHDENVVVLEDPPLSLRGHRLLADHYVHRFLLQHYAQHLETMDYVRAQRDPASRPAAPAGEASGHATGWVTLSPGRYTVGCADTAAYDNEHTPHTVTLEGVHLATTLVSNAEFAQFMADGGYHRREFWDEAGWRWCVRYGIDRPGYWPGADGAAPTGADSAVVGLSHFEAAAYARWAGARLPHEHEWEAAHRHGLLDGVGGAWEWCANPFFPYPGFRPFPYEGYSRPWFDDAHYVLRGASPATRPSVRRPSFRNFYTRDVRHVFAGLRLALDLQG